LYSIILYYIVLYCIVLYNIILYYIYYIVLYYIVLYNIILYFIYYIICYHIVLFCIVLYCIRSISYHKYKYDIVDLHLSKLTGLVTNSESFFFLNWNQVVVQYITHVIGKHKVLRD